MADPLDVTLEPLNSKKLEQLKLLNAAVLPVRFPESFYNDVVASARESTVLAHLDDILVGGVATRIEKAKDGAPGARLYIGSACVLAPYRGRGIGTKLITRCIEAVMDWGDANIKDAYLHVQSNNDEAIRFYEKHGFVKERLVENYYKRIDPPHAQLMVRPFVYPPNTPSVAAE